MAEENGSHVQCTGAEGELPHVSVGIPAYSRREERVRMIGARHVYAISDSKSPDTSDFIGIPVNTRPSP